MHVLVLLMGCSGRLADTSMMPTTENDAASIDAQAEDATANDEGSPYDTPLMCTSAQHWTGRASRTMAPGEACIECHGRSFGAPLFSVAGTVYPTAHEPDDCNGIAGATAVTVVIVDATGASTTLQVNAVGNFYAQVSLTKPFRAKVTSAAGERVMTTPQMIGDCNSCHTQDGANGAPGRIMAP
jgi:cytochrome c553